MFGFINIIGISFTRGGWLRLVYEVKCLGGINL